MGADKLHATTWLQSVWQKLDQTEETLVGAPPCLCQDDLASKQ